MTQPNPWNSLEVAKLVVSVLSTLVFLYLGLRVNRAAHRLEAAQWINQKIIEKRLELYDKIAPSLNDLHCFYVRVGHWKEITPPQIIEIKRVLDRQISISAPLFSSDFRRVYDQFIFLCFDMLVTENSDAQIRTLTDQRVGLPTWHAEWQTMFSAPATCPPPYEVLAAYEALMARFAKELGL